MVTISLLYQQSDHIRQSCGLMENWRDILWLSSSFQGHLKVIKKFDIPSTIPTFLQTGFILCLSSFYEYTFILGSYPFLGNFFIIEVPSWKVFFCLFLLVIYLWNQHFVSNLNLISSLVFSVKIAYEACLESIIHDVK